MVMAMYLEDAADGRWSDDGSGSVSGKGGFYLIYICLVGGAESVVVVVAVWWLLCGWWWWVVETHFFLILSLCLARLRPPPLQIDSAALSSADAANHIPIPTRSIVTTNTRLNVLSP